VYRPEMNDMNEIPLIITVALYCVLAAKKKPVFGQMTLTGMLALDWMKPGTETTATKIQIGHPSQFESDWNVPEWAKEKAYVALLYPEDIFSNPIFVSQASIVKWLEAQCSVWEEAGAKVSMTKNIATIEFEENFPVMVFNRDEKAGKFAPYLCALKE